MSDQSGHTERIESINDILNAAANGNYMSTERTLELLAERESLKGRYVDDASAFNVSNTLSPRPRAKNSMSTNRAWNEALATKRAQRHG